MLAAAIVVGLARGGDGDVVIRPGEVGAPAATARTGAATELVSRLGEALARGDERAAAALAPSDDPRAAARLAAVARNVRALRLTDVSLRFVDQSGSLAPDGRWTASVEATWRLGGLDPRAADAEIGVRLLQRGGTLAVTGFGGAGRAPLWTTGPLTVLRGPRTLVLAQRPADARRLDALARTAVRQVADRLDLPSTRLVVEAPGSGAALDAALAAEPGTYRQIAAVTAPVDGSPPGRAPIHVLVNPDVLNRLDRAGAQVVLTHETVHAATRAPASRAPSWLIEGFADWVALQEVRLPLRTTTARLAARIAREGLPRRLPTSADFAVDRTDLEASYEAAWQLCVTIADAAGPDALRALYDRSADGSAFAADLRRTTGLEEARLLALWRTRLGELPRASTGSGARSVPDRPAA